MTANSKRQESWFKLAFWKRGKKSNDLLNKKDRIKCMLEGIVIIVLFSWFFYRSALALPFLLPVYLLYQSERQKILRKKRQKEAVIQFKDAILSVFANQKAGYSIENAFQQALGDMELLYGKESMICRELYIVVAGLKNNMSIESLLHDFGIEVVISARQLEQRIMNIVPFGILLYISAASEGFFDVLYRNAAGVVLMSICMAVYIGAVFLSGKIVDIEV